jgi:hypothetical protein
MTNDSLQYATIDDIVTELSARYSSFVIGVTDAKGPMPGELNYLTFIHGSRAVGIGLVEIIKQQALAEIAGAQRAKKLDCGEGSYGD